MPKNNINNYKIRRILKPTKKKKIKKLLQKKIVEETYYLSVKKS